MYTRQMSPALSLPHRISTFSQAFVRHAIENAVRVHENSSESTRETKDMKRGFEHMLEFITLCYISISSANLALVSSSTIRSIATWLDMEERSRGLESLPWELLCEIQLLSLSASLPLVSRAVRQSLSHPSPTFAAIYLLDLYAPPKVPTADVLARALRHRICTLETVREMERIWDRRRGIRPLAAKQNASATCHLQGEQEEEDEDEPPPEPTAPPLSLSELPRRIFRVPALDPHKTLLSPLLKYLFDKFTPSADSHQGYALSRATLLSDHPLIDFLLAHGADPNQRDAFAVQIAVSKADLALVKLLVERKEQGGKRRRMEDRVQVTQTLVRRAMQNDRTPEGRAVIDYFVNEKGSVPSLNSILKMGSKRASKRSRVRA